MPLTMDSTDVYTRHEIVDLMEEIAKLRLGCPAIDVVRSYERGELSDPGHVVEVLALARLLSQDDPFFGPAE